jgi:hypothetical protein
VDVTGHDKPAVVFDAGVFTAWLHSRSEQQPPLTWAEVFGIDSEVTCTSEGFLPMLDDILSTPPAGLWLHGDVSGIGLWRIPDGDALDQGALITVDLTSDLRLASRHQDLDDLAPPGHRGAAAACAAMSHIVELADHLVTQHRQLHGGTEACRHRRLVEQIWTAMYPPDQPYWSPDTLDEIAAVLLAGGYPPR